MAQAHSFEFVHQQRAAARPTTLPRYRVCVVGAGTRFLSGISIYTMRLANAFAAGHDVSVILMRQLLPTRFYPGHARVGANLTQLAYDPRIRVCDGVDWFWLPSIVWALAMLIKQRPQMVVFQWWSGTVLHSYLLLALVARLFGARITIEFHEVLDTGEANMPPVRAYVRLVAPVLVRLASGFTVHSAFDQQQLREHYRLGDRPVLVLPHAPHDHYLNDAAHDVFRQAPPNCCNLLFFGVIRPYKGLEDLIRAFDAIPEDQIEQYWLTVVGETWEGWTLPAELIAQSRYRARISFVNRYVHDQEVAAFFNGADAVVLPYHRSSMSGPLHVAMSYGLPIVVTDVGGLAEAVTQYHGAVLVPPRDPAAIREGLAQAAALRGKRFAHPQSWEQTTHSYEALFAGLEREHEQAAS